MRGFIFDENVPCRLTFEPDLPVEGARDATGAGSPDTALWDHAARRSMVIVTKDADFSERILAASPPPWVVHLRLGNMRARQFHDVLKRAWPIVRRLLPDHKLVVVFPDRVEAVR